MKKIILWDVISRKQLGEFTVLDDALQEVGALLNYYGKDALPMFALTEPARRGRARYIMDRTEFETQVLAYYNPIIARRFAEKRSQMSSVRF